MMAGFSMPGLGSGGALDITTMLAEIKKAEQTKLVPYNTKKTSYSGQVSSWGKISSSLSALKDNLGKIDKEGFKGVNVGNNKAFKATAGAGAMPDSYSIYVEQLAKAHKIGTGEQTTKTEQLGDQSAETRKLKISVGDGKEMEVELSKDETSLEQIAKKINGQKGDVTASVRAGENGGYSLVLTSKKTGADGVMTVKVEGDDKLGEVMNYTPADPSVTPMPGPPATGMKTIADAQNAIVVIDGTRIERSSNTITDAVDGITLELQQVSEKDKDSGDFIYETLSLTSDSTKFKGAIEEFVKLYNAFLDTSSSASQWKEPGDDGKPNAANGALMGNSTLRRLTNDMRADTVGTYGELSDVFSSLADLGIKVEVEDAATGKLTIDSKKLEAAINEHPEEIEALFLGKGNNPGISDKMQNIITTYIGDSDAIPKTKGVIEQTTKGLEEQTKQVSERIKQLEKMIDVTLERNRKDFERLDLAMGKMNNTSNMLTSLLSGM
jgi:flagellar hook-associated protein 2